MIRESAVFGRDVGWYVVMIGKKASLTPLFATLRDSGADVRRGEVALGRTVRWLLAWSFAERSAAAQAPTASDTAVAFPLHIPLPRGATLPAVWRRLRQIAGAHSAIRTADQSGALRLTCTLHLRSALCCRAVERTKGEEKCGGSAAAVHLTLCTDCATGTTDIRIECDRREPACAELMCIAADMRRGVLLSGTAVADR